MAYDDHPVRGHGRPPVTSWRSHRQKIDEHDVVAVAREQRVESFGMCDATLAAGALEDGPGVVTLLQRLHRTVYDGTGPPDVSVAVGGVVHQVDHPCAGRAGADLAEDDLAVMLAVPLHVREPGAETPF